MAKKWCNPPSSKFKKQFRHQLLVTIFMRMPPKPNPQCSKIDILQLWFQRVVLYTSHLHHLLLWIENQMGHPKPTKAFQVFPPLIAMRAAGRSQSAGHGHCLGRRKHGLDDSPGLLGGSLPCHQASSWKWLLSSPGLFVLCVPEFWLKRYCRW